MSDDVFADQKQTTEQNTNPLAELVGPDKKFKTPEDLAKGKIESDAFIEQLKREVAGLREDLTKRVSTDEEIAEVREELKALRQAKPEQSRDNTNPQLTVDGIRALVAQEMTQAEGKRTSQQNILTANAGLVEHYGDLTKATEAVQVKARELGLSMEDLKAIASKSPTAFTKIILGDSPEQSIQPLDTKSRVSTDPSVNIVAGSRAPQPGTKEYYENLRKTNNKQYWTPKVQQEIFELVKAGKYQP